MSRIVALTGATGFIGQVIWQFLLKAGWTVRPLVRPSSHFLAQRVSTDDVIQGTLREESSLQALVEGVDAVVHCAGTVRGRTHSDFSEANVEGVRRLVQIASSHCPRARFVLISSLAAREPQLSSYAKSKRDGEEVLSSLAGSMPWVILRPPAVYGPCDRALRPLFSWIRRGIGIRLGEKDARFSMLYVDDLAEAVTGWLELGYPISQVFELHDGHEKGYSWDEVSDLLSSKKVFRIVVPGCLLSTVARGNEGFAQLFKYAPILTMGKVRELRHPNWVCDNRKISDGIGWTPQVGLKDGVMKTFNAMSES